MRLRHRHFVGHYRAFSDFARGPWSVHPTRSLRSEEQQTKWKCAGCSPTSFAFHLSRSARAFFMSLTKVMHLVSAVLCFWGDWGDRHTVDFHFPMRIWGFRSVHGLWLLSRTISSTFWSMLEINYKDEEWYNWYELVFTLGILNDKPILIMLLSFSGSIVIIISVNWKLYQFQQQITKKLLPAPEHLQSKYHKRQGYVPP